MGERDDQNCLPTFPLPPEVPTVLLDCVELGEASSGLLQFSALQSSSLNELIPIVEQFLWLFELLTIFWSGIAFDHSMPQLYLRLPQMI